MKYQVSYTVTKEFSNAKKAAKYYASLQRQPSTYKDLKTTFITETKKCAFLDFLDNNPPNEVQSTSEPTEEQKIAWEAEYEEEAEKLAHYLDSL